MAIEPGYPFTLTVDDSGGSGDDLSDNMNNLVMSITRNTSVKTGADKSAEERLQLLADFSATLDGAFDDAADKSHIAFRDIGSTDVSRTLVAAISGQTLTVETIVTEYTLTRDISGDFGYNAAFVLQSGTDPVWA